MARIIEVRIIPSYEQDITVQGRDEPDGLVVWCNHAGGYEDAGEDTTFYNDGREISGMYHIFECDKCDYCVPIEDWEDYSGKEASEWS